MYKHFYLEYYDHMATHYLADEVEPSNTTQGKEINEINSSNLTGMNIAKIFENSNLAKHKYYLIYIKQKITFG